MRFNADGLLAEKPLGICPSCGEAVYASEEQDSRSGRVIWVCASDLDPRHICYQVSEVTPEEMARAFNPSHCPQEYGRSCSLDHFPLHGHCQ